MGGQNGLDAVARSLVATEAANKTANNRMVFNVFFFIIFLLSGKIPGGRRLARRRALGKAIATESI